MRIKDYEKFNTQIQVVCTIPVLFAYFAHPEHGLKVAKFLNDDLSNLVHKYPKRYIGLGTLPMQAPDLAVEELHRIKKMGLVGIQIGSNINNKGTTIVIGQKCKNSNIVFLVFLFIMIL